MLRLLRQLIIRELPQIISNFFANLEIIALHCFTFYHFIGRNDIEICQCFHVKIRILITEIGGVDIPQLALRSSRYNALRKIQTSRPRISLCKSPYCALSNV